MKRTLSLAMLVFAACATSSVAVAQAAAPSGAQAQVSNVIVVKPNTQATVGDNVRIAAYNVRDEAYKDASGADKRGLTAALQVFVREDASKNQKLRVHPGSVFSAGGKTFEVTAIDAVGVRIAFK